MKKRFNRLSSSRSFAILFFILSFVALGSLFPRQALACCWGWEPDDPNSWGGGWDASLKCDSVEGITTLDRTPFSGPTVAQDGRVSCTFTDPANSFVETALCSLDIKFEKLTQSCAANNDGTSTLTVSGTCPFEKGKTMVGATGAGTIDCAGGGPGGADPTFCKYAGNDPNGNLSGDCTWNVGFGQLNGSNVVPLTQSQCETAFPATTDLGVSQVFKFTQTYTGAICTGDHVGVGPKIERFCHSDTWDGSVLAACEFPKGVVKNTASGEVASHLTADTEYSPTTINSTCNPTNSGIVTLTVLANTVDPNTNPVALAEIDQSTITVNGNPIVEGTSCTFDVLTNPNVMTCQIKRCHNGHNIIADTIAPDRKTATLTMDAFMNDGTHVVGDLETRNAN